MVVFRVPALRKPPGQQQGSPEWSGWGWEKPRPVEGLYWGKPGKLWGSEASDSSERVSRLQRTGQCPRHALQGLPPAAHTYVLVFLLGAPGKSPHFPSLPQPTCPHPSNKNYNHSRFHWGRAMGKLSSQTAPSPILPLWPEELWTPRKSIDRWGTAAGRDAVLAQGDL